MAEAYGKWLNSLDRAGRDHRALRACGPRRGARARSSTPRRDTAPPGTAHCAHTYAQFLTRARQRGRRAAPPSNPARAQHPQPRARGRQRRSRAARQRDNRAVARRRGRASRPRRAAGRRAAARRAGTAGAARRLAPGRGDPPMLSNRRAPALARAFAQDAMTTAPRVGLAAGAERGGGRARLSAHGEGVAAHARRRRLPARGRPAAGSRRCCRPRASLTSTLHVEPIPPALAADRLRRQRARLESSRRIDADRGRLTDPALAAAAEDAEELAGALARGESRLFRSGLYLSVTAPSREELEERTERVKALCASMLLHVVPGDVPAHWTGGSRRCRSARPAATAAHVRHRRARRRIPVRLR